MCLVFCHLPFLLIEPQGNCNINQGCKKQIFIGQVNHICIAYKETA